MAQLAAVVGVGRWQMRPGMSQFEFPQPLTSARRFSPRRPLGQNRTHAPQQRTPYSLGSDDRYGVKDARTASSPDERSEIREIPPECSPGMTGVKHPERSHAVGAA
jgi:hypothetical protein